MKHWKYTGLFFSIFFALGFIFIHNKELSPLNIKVVDAVAGKSLEGILVYRILESYYVKDRVLFIIPSPEPKVIRKIEISEKYLTDKNGIVQIDKQSINLRKKENLHRERICVNLDIDMNIVPDYMKEYYETKFHAFNHYIGGYIGHRDKFFRPNPEYRGANILSGEDYLWPEGFVDQTDYEDVDFYWNEVKWDEKEKRTMTIQLKSYCPEEAARAEVKREERRRRYREKRDKRIMGITD